MKKKHLFIILVAVFALSCPSGFSQVKVYEDNRVKIFGDRPADDYDKDLSLQVYGTYGEYLANGRVGFGSYGIDELSIYRKRVFVGELGNNYDSDKLELCGSTGLYLTWGQGYEFNSIIGKFELGPLWEPQTFCFNTDVYAKGFILNSDEKFKVNIKHLKDATTRLKQIRSFTFNLKNNETKSPFLTETLSPVSDKEKKDLELLASTKERMEDIFRERIGFLADELRNVFPELVEEDTDGFLYVDYFGLIPVLVESIKEQQSQIATLKNLIQKL